MFRLNDGQSIEQINVLPNDTHLQQAAILTTTTKQEESVKRRQVEAELEEMLGADALKSIKGNFEGVMKGDAPEKKERQKLTDMDTVSLVNDSSCGPS